MAITYITRTGKSIEELANDFAHLRINVFASYPYLYQGSLEYEQSYIKIYTNSVRTFMFSVYDGAQMVGATTCIPLLEESEEVQKPFKLKGYDLNTIFYFGESILLEPYRNLGIGHRFFDEREAHVRSFEGQYSTTCFCAVQRPENHALRPANYQPLDRFWTKRGYRKEPSLESEFEWLDIGENQMTTKKMVYWIHRLDKV